MSHQQDWLQTVEPVLHGRWVKYFIWPEVREANVPVIVPETSGVVDPPRFAQHIYSSLPMIMETGTEDHSIFDNTPGETRLKAKTRLVQTFEAASAQEKDTEAPPKADRTKHFQQ